MSADITLYQHQKNSCWCAHCWYPCAITSQPAKLLSKIFTT
jgi:hypothetical protein